MIECPANYFGKGRFYSLSEDPKEIEEFERKFSEWVSLHPDDPTGELALEKEEREMERNIPQIPESNPMFVTSQNSTLTAPAPNPPTEISRSPDAEPSRRIKTQAKYFISLYHQEKLRKYASSLDKHPAEIVADFIDTLPNVTKD